MVAHRQLARALVRDVGTASVGSIAGTCWPGRGDAAALTSEEMLFYTCGRARWAMRAAREIS